MANHQLQQKSVEKLESKQNSSLKGTFASVMLLGAFIIVSWVGVWILFLSR
ncbi:cytochrome c oxidase subunit 2A [Lentibacillus sp. N15]|uniref:cytochrome c oxidase subunit 2A n=1 Tax=Lentibacillus songyuanensis TaxID=3136161 RepID=UPI0031BA72D3